MRRVLTPYVFGIATGIALVAAIAAASTAGSALRVDGVEHGDGASIVFVAALGLALGFYVGGLLILRRAGSRVAAVCAIAVGIQLIPLAGPLLLSHDVYSYWAYARVTARHDSNPYAVPPGRFRDDPATQAVARGWRDTTSVYGPGFTATSIVVDRAAASKESVAFVFRALAAVAAIGATLLAAWIARRKSFAAAFVGWNPLLAISFAGGGHNDALMVALMLAAIALGLRRREVASGSVWILAGAVKAPAVFLLVLQLVRSPRRLWLASGVAAVIASVVATFAFGTSWVVSLFHIGSNESRYALPVRLEQIGVPDGAAHLAAAAVLVAGSAWLVRQAARGRPRLALGACLLVLTSPWLLPWYATWPVALAAVEEDAAAQVLALVVVAYLLPSRIPF